MTTYIVHENGKATVHEMSPEMARIAADLRDWIGWCKCGNPEAGEISHRGHSVDVSCRNCGGCIQIG